MRDEQKLQIAIMLLGAAIALTGAGLLFGGPGVLMVLGIVIITVSLSRI